MSVDCQDCFSSVLTAPIGAALALTGMFGRTLDFSSRFFKLIIISVLMIGMSLSIAFGSSPLQLILFAQVANAIILPFIAVFVMMCSNSTSMGKHKTFLATLIKRCYFYTLKFNLRFIFRTLLNNAAID